MNKKNIAFFGSSLLSAYWNGAATYYRGIIKNLAREGFSITFYEPDAFQRQEYRDMEEPDWAKVFVYPNSQSGVKNALLEASDADIIVKASGVGVFDAFLEIEVIELKNDNNLVFFWDVDAPATLSTVIENKSNPFNKLIPKYDAVFTYGGGNPVIDAYTSLGAKKCIPIYNALDPDTHFPVEKDKRFNCELAFLGNRMPDREARVQEFFLSVAGKLPDSSFVLGGSGWDSAALSSNINYVGHVFTADHNAFNCTPKAVLNISRQSMASYGFAPATRVFEAAGAGACIITDYWKGIEQFLEPDKEILVARNGDEVIQHLSDLSEERAKAIGEAARKRVLAEHTYEIRAKKLKNIFKEFSLVGEEMGGR